MKIDHRFHKYLIQRKYRTREQMYNAVYDFLDVSHGCTMTEISNSTGITKEAVKRFLRMLVHDEKAFEGTDPKRRCYLYFKVEIKERDNPPKNMMNDGGAESKELKILTEEPHGQI